jgi:hypothetical protein
MLSTLICNPAAPQEVDLEVFSRQVAKESEQRQRIITYFAHIVTHVWKSIGRTSGSLNVVVIICLLYYVFTTGPATCMQA